MNELPSTLSGCIISFLPVSSPTKNILYDLFPFNYVYACVSVCRDIYMSADDCRPLGSCLMWALEPNSSSARAESGLQLESSPQPLLRISHHLMI